MISIIVCSKNARPAEDFAENIRQTVGTDFELVHVDDSRRQHSIFEAYNSGVERAQGDILCFVHEDVVFHSRDWGRTVAAALADDRVGAIGVAGGYFIPRHADWRFYADGYAHLIQGAFTVEEQPRYYVCHYPDREDGSGLTEVAVIDGVWMCMRRELFATIRFDDRRFGGFHLYDTDISMQIVQTGRRLFVTADVLLEHRSEGNFSAAYADSVETFMQKWAHLLPCRRGGDSHEQETEEKDLAARRRMDERVAHDTAVARLHELFAAKREGKACRDYTEEEKRIMDRSVYQSCKLAMKQRQVGTPEALARLRDYLAWPLARQRARLIRKFVWYRILTFGTKRA